MKTEKMKKAVLVVSVVLGLCASAFATEYYVDKDNGSDFNSGLSLAEAFETIQKAVVTFSGGDTIYIAQASAPYYEPINLTTRSCSGTAEQYTKICGLDGQRPVISGVGYTYYQGKIINLKDKQFIELCNLEVESNAYCIGMGHYGGGADNCKIHNIIFRSISGSREGVGIQFGDVANNNEAYNNIFYNLNVGAQLGAGSACTGTQVLNNLFYNCNKGVAFYEATRPELNLIANNIATNCDVGFYGNGPMEDGPIYNSCVFNNGTDFQGPEIYGLYTVSGDPLFVDPGSYDFHIRYGSPCIDAGMDTNISRDFDGNIRPKDTYYDIGPYEGSTIVDANTYYVDGATGSNSNDGLSRETAFETIQYAIDEANDWDTVLVWPGVYNEAATHGINFKGKAITVKSAADAAVLEVPGYVAVTFVQGEDENSVLSNFVIRGSLTGIFALFADPTISNVTVVGNDNGIIADNANPLITNSIFWNNTNGDLLGIPTPIQARYSFVQDEIEANLVAYWKLDGDATDSAGTNDGTIYGATPTTGQVGGALQFDGDDYVNVGNLGGFLPKGTIEFWMKPTRVANYRNPLTTDFAGQNTGIRFEEESSGRFVVVIAAGPGIDDPGIHEYLSSGLQMGTWYHVVLVWDSSSNTVKGYLDGAEKFNESHTNNWPSTFPDVQIGRGFDTSSGRAWKGSIDNVRIYDRALSAAEIQVMYKIELAGHEYGPLFTDANAGDYHLLSERGRYRATTDEWILDDVTSVCVDGGDPNIAPTNEPMPNGGRINTGAYGNTSTASMSEWPLEGDFDYDGIVGIDDIGIFSDEWLESLDFSEEPSCSEEHTGTVLFFDGFENIDAGNYPDENGWQVMFSGVSASVSDDVAHAGSKSFHLDGTSWGRHDYVSVGPPEWTSNYMTYEVSFYTPVGNAAVGRMGFGDPESGDYVSYRNSFWVGSPGGMNEITFGTYYKNPPEGESLISVGTYTPGTWATVRADLYFDSLQADLWLNGELKVIGAPIKPKEWTHPEFGYDVHDKWVIGSGGDTYFDDVILASGPYITYHVDGVSGDNANDGFTPGTAFATIQKGVSEARDCDMVLVWPGVYNESVYIVEKEITVKSADEPAVIDGGFDDAVAFYSWENKEAVLKNFIIQNGFAGVYVYNGSPRLENLTIVDCFTGIEAEDDAEPNINSCILANNDYDLYNCTAQYSWIGDEHADQNLVAYWKLDGNATDSAGSNNGTIYGATPATGQINDALDFDGVDDYVEVADSPTLRIADKVTIEFWAKRKRLDFVDTVVVKGSDWALGTTNYGIGLYHMNNHMCYFFYDGGWRGTSGVSDLDWHHYAVVAEQGNINPIIYIDGQARPIEFTAGTGTISLNPSATPLRIGALLDWSYYGKNIIDELRIYNRSLSAEEIEVIYAVSLAGHSYSEPLFADANSCDYHLLSERGRYRATTDEWILDDVTSPCVDGGDPYASLANERMPNGGRVNMGAYGGTRYASMSEWPFIADLNLDGIVNFKDFATLARRWLQGNALHSPPPPPLPSKASNPNPADGATNVGINADLSWTAGPNAVSHDVYFGTTSPGTFRGNQIAATFDTGAMAYNTTYYWRVDEVNATGTTVGTVWSFTTESGPPPP